VWIQSIHFVTSGSFSRASGNRENGRQAVTIEAANDETGGWRRCERSPANALI